MNVLEKILEEIEEKFKTADADKFDCEELCDVEDWYDSGYIDGQLSAHEKCMDIIRSHMGEAKDINVPSNDEIEPVSEEFLKDCAETAKKYNRENNGWIPVEEGLPEEEQKVMDLVR